MALKRSKSASDVGNPKKMKSQKDDRPNISPKAKPNKTIKPKYEKKSSPGKKKEVSKKVEAKTSDSKLSDAGPKKPGGSEKSNKQQKKGGRQPLKKGAKQAEKNGARHAQEKFIDTKSTEDGSTKVSGVNKKCNKLQNKGGSPLKKGLKQAHKKGVRQAKDTSIGSKSSDGNKPVSVDKKENGLKKKVGRHSLKKGVRQPEKKGVKQPLKKGVRQPLKKGARQPQGFTEFPKKLIGKDGKPEWNKVKLEKLELKKNRKVHRTGEEHYQMSVKAKSKWEKLRQKKLSPEKKEILVNELFMLLKGQISNVVHSHDLARVLQWMLKLGSADVRTAICEELCGNTVAYLKSKYASHCINAALRYGSKSDRKSIIQSCKGHFHKLLSYTFGSPIVETMYTKFASADQRKQMHKELYGEMNALIPSEVSTIEQIPKDLRPAILTATKTNLMKLLSKKELLKSTLLQSVLNDYLASCSEEDRIEISELIQGEILELINSKEGCRVALLVIWSATNKVKKVIVKSIKGKMKEIATSEVGHILLMALFDSIDDTVLVNKALIPELVSEAKEMAKDECGRKVILYLVAHRDPAYFHPQQMEILSKGDAISKRKKDTAVREQEMLNAVSGPLLEKIVEDPGYWFGESSVAMVSLAIMKSGNGDALKKAYEKLVAYILDPTSLIEVNYMQVHAIEYSACHLVLKKLIQQDQTEKKSETFSNVLVSNLTEESLRHILQFNRGCFLLVLLLESKNNKVCKVLKSKLTESLRTLLRKQETTGAKILLMKLAN